MTTKEKLVSDIVLQLTQGNPSDDLALEEEQVAYWIDYHLNDLIRREIVDALKKGDKIPPIYIRRDIALKLTEETVADVSNAKQRFYLTLQEEVIDLPRDGGIVRVLDYDRNLVRMTSVEDLEDLRHLRFAKPSPENPIAYREGKKIFIEGINTADVSFNPFMCSYIPKQNILSLTDNAEILITDQLIPILVDLCVQRGKLVLYGSQSDDANDGVDKKQTQYHTAISNPTKEQPQPEQ